jgi:endoglucanase
MLSAVFSCQLMAQTATFKNNDRICFIGNSITYMGGYHHNIALYYATRFPQEKIAVFNCGIGGNVAANVIARMDSDILVNKPNWAAVKLGMNDVRKDLYTKEAAAKPNVQQLRQDALDVYRKNYELIIQTLLQKNCRVILQTPSIYDETAALADVRLPGRNNALQIAAGYVKELGAKYKLPVVDYWTILNTLTQQVQSKDSTATLIGADRVHPGAVGHFIMAYAFLEATAGPSVVSDITVDAAKNTTPVSRNAKLSDWVPNEKGFTCTVLEQALPFPAGKEVAGALQLVPFGEEFNKERITVKGLTAGRYKLLIDGKLVGVYTHEAWATGIDLAGNAGTPQFQQAQQVLSLFRQCWQLEGAYRNMRGIEFGRLRGKGIITLADAEKYFDNQAKVLTDTTAVAYKDLQGYLKNYLPNKRKEKEILEKMEQLQTAIYQANQPRPHQYQIIKE